ncbi:MAG TPA: adenylate/guanylate cyclase domain-containing protein [Dongiaceae bacterium]|nr:adenylate/guanylate cyclase domain-containing protein [Dongiaceae bacterium]
MSVRSKNFSLWLSIIVIGALAGIGYNLLLRAGDRPFVAMVYGVAICCCALGYERGLLLGGLRRRLRRLPSLAYILASELILAGLVLAGTVIGGSVAWAAGLLGKASWIEAVSMRLDATVYSLIIIACFVFVARMRDLLGADVFRNLLLGRYHRPAQEERLFLFIDIAGSTAYAESHGDLRAQEYLGAIFAAFADPVRRHRGVIDDYIGDLAIISWPLRQGAQQARCLLCLVDVYRQFADDAPAWRKDFGQVPSFRAALHGGPIVTAEIGVDRHKIAYFGDVVNTTARLEALSRSLNEPALISDELLTRLPPLPPSIGIRPLGQHAIRGRDQSLAISALDIAIATEAAPRRTGADRKPLARNLARRHRPRSAVGAS